MVFGLALVWVGTLASACVSHRNTGGVSEAALRTSILATCPLAPCIIDGDVHMVSDPARAVEAEPVARCWSTAPESPHGRNWNYNFRLEHVWQVERQDHPPFAIVDKPTSATLYTVHKVPIPISDHPSGFHGIHGAGYRKKVSFSATALSVSREGSQLVGWDQAGAGMWQPRYKSILEWDGDVHPMVGHVQWFVNEVTECHFH